MWGDPHERNATKMVIFPSRPYVRMDETLLGAERDISFLGESHPHVALLPKSYMLDLCGGVWKPFAHVDIHKNYLFSVRLICPITV